MLNSRDDVMSRPIELVSDFSDYYDRRLLDGDGESRVRYSRHASNDLSHQNALAFLMDKGYPVPIHGLVRHMSDTIDLIAVYTDDTAHPRGERCAVMPRSDAMAECPNSFAVEYKGEIGSPSISYREVRIGSSRWLLKYVSDHPWASNQGDVEITLVDRLESGWDNRFRFPVYAVDYVTMCDHIDRWWLSRRATRFYFDLRICPKIDGTPVADILLPEQVAYLIREALARFNVLDAQHKKELTIPHRSSYTKVSDHE